MADNFDIRHERGRYAVYINDSFYCTADTSREAADEIEAYKEQKVIDELVSNGPIQCALYRNIHNPEPQTILEPDWNRAVEHVKKVLYEKYSPGYYKVCSKLLKRYSNGDRSRDLYERMIAIQ